VLKLDLNNPDKPAQVVLDFVDCEGECKTSVSTHACMSGLGVYTPVPPYYAGFALDKQDNLYVTSWGSPGNLQTNSTVIKVDARTGNVSDFIEGRTSIYFPAAIALDPDGKVHVSSWQWASDRCTLPADDDGTPSSHFSDTSSISIIPVSPNTTKPPYTIDQYCSLCSYRHGDRNVKFSGQFTCDNGLRSMVFDGEGNLYIGYRGYAGSSHGPGYQDGVMPSYIVWKSKADGSVYSFEITKAPLRHFNLDTARQDE
jgi:hypothetical protein